MYNYVLCIPPVVSAPVKATIRHAHIRDKGVRSRNDILSLFQNTRGNEGKTDKEIDTCSFIGDIGHKVIPDQRYHTT